MSIRKYIGNLLIFFLLLNLYTILNFLYHNNKKQLFQEIYFPGGTADPNLKVAGQGVQATWMGSSAGVDLTTPSATIGPDGITDLQISLTQLDPLKSVKAVDVVDANNVWIASYGLNPSRVGTAELSRNPSAPEAGSKSETPSCVPVDRPLRYKALLKKLLDHFPQPLTNRQAKSMASDVQRPLSSVIHDV